MSFASGSHQIPYLPEFCTIASYQSDDLLKSKSGSPLHLLIQKDAVDLAIDLVIDLAAVA